MDLYRRFDTALHEIVDEMKSQRSIKGVFTFGSYVKGTTTPDSDLDICVAWDGNEAPVELLAEKKGVRIDLSYRTIDEFEKTLAGEMSDVLKTASIIGMLRDARIVLDPDGLIKKWQGHARIFVWKDDAIDTIKQRAMGHLERASKYMDSEDLANAVYELRRSLFEVSRVILMRNNIFTIVKPSEILSEIRMLDPITYQLFLRTFKLKTMNENELLDALSRIKPWMQKAVTTYENSSTSIESRVVANIAEAQRQYYGSYRLTLNGEYELAILEMCEAISLIAKVLLEIAGHKVSDENTLISLARDHEREYFDEIMFPLASFEFPPKSVKRGISETQFIVQRI